MSLDAFQRNLVRQDGPEEMGGGGEYKDSRVEQDIKAEVVTSVDGHLGCEELLLSPATTTLQQVADDAVRCGLPHDTQLGGPDETGGALDCKDLSPDDTRIRAERVEQAMKVEVVTSVDDHLGCEE
jgi:hypothetical protein